MTNGLFFGEINKEEDDRLTIELTDKEIVGIICGKGGVGRGVGRGEVHKGRQKGPKWGASLVKWSASETRSETRKMVKAYKSMERHNSLSYGATDGPKKPTQVSHNMVLLVIRSLWK